MDNPPEGGCPVTKALHDTLQAGTDFARAIRRLRREARLCRTCPHATRCPVRAGYNQAIKGAIQEVRRAWETRE